MHSPTPNRQSFEIPSASTSQRVKKAWLLLTTLTSCLLTAGLSAATLTYDNDVNDANGITEGTTSGWNTTPTNTPWYDSINDTFLAWPNTSADIAIFGGGSSGTAGSVTVGTVTANGIIFNTPNAGSYTLTGGTITLAGTTPTLTANADATINSILAGADGLTKNGTGNLTLGGAASNTYTGTTNVLAGTLTLNKTGGQAVSGDVIINGGLLIWARSNMVSTTASITLISGGLQLAGYTQTVANLTLLGGNSNANTSSNGGTFTVTDTLTVSQSGALGLNSNGQWTVNKADFTGSTAALNLTGNGARITQFNVGGGGLILSGQTVNLSKGSVATAQGSELVIDGKVTASGSNTIRLNGSNTFGAAQLRLAGTHEWEVATDGLITITANIVGSAGLTKTGAGSILISGTEANTFTGMTTVSGGTLRLGKTAGVAAIQGDITVLTGGILDWDTANQLSLDTNIFLNGGSLKFDNQTQTFASLTQTAGTVNFNNGTNSGLVTITGLLRVSGGSGINLNSAAVWSVGAADFTGFNGTAISLYANSPSRVNQFIVGEGGLTLSGQTLSVAKASADTGLGSELTLNGDVTASGTNNINAGSNLYGVSQVQLGEEDRTFNITAGTTSSTANFVSTGGGVIKTGSGILALNAFNTYTGNTTINAGTLKLGTAGTVNVSPVITVAEGAFFNVSDVLNFAIQFDQRLEGGGTVTGALALGFGATLAPGTTGGDGFQKLTITGTLALDFGSQTLLQIAGLDAYDQIRVDGNLTQVTGAQIIVSGEDFTPELGQTFQLFDWGGLSSFTGNLGDTYRDGSADDATDLNLPDISGTGWVWDISQFTTQGIIAIVVPEPSRFMLMLLAGSLLILRRRR